MMLVPALVAAAALGAPARPPAVAKDGRVQTPEGIRFQLPRGFAYEVQEQEGSPVYLAHDSTGEAGVTAMVISGEPLDCAAADARQMGFEPFRTAKGLEGCVKVVAAGEAGGEADAGGAAPEGALAILLVGAGKVVVSVNAVTRDRAQAPRLARGVADTLTIPRPLAGATPEAARRGGSPVEAAVEPLLVGCFEYSASHVGLSSSAGAIRTRCLRADGTFEERVVVHASADSDEVSGSAHDEGRSRGRWSYRNKVLELLYEDGTRSVEEIQLGSIGYIVGRSYWRKYASE